MTMPPSAVPSMTPPLASAASHVALPAALPLPAFLYDPSTIAPLTPGTLLVVVAEHATLVPAIVLCFAVAWDLLRAPRRRTVAVSALAVAAYLAVSVWLYFFAPVADVVGASLSLAFAAFVCLWFWHVTELDLPRALFTSLSCASMMAVCVFVGQLADMVANDEWRALGPYSSYTGIIAEYALAAVAVALLWRPGRAVMPRILRSGVIGAVAWRILWVVPFGLYVLLMMYHGRRMDVMHDATAQLGVLAVTMYCALILLLYWLLAKVDGEASRRVEAEQSARQLALGRMQVRSLTERMAQARRSRHDLRQHMVALHAYARNDDLPGLRAYLDGLVADLDEEPLTVCDHVVVDAVVSYYAAAARSCGADVDLRLDVPADLPFDATDLTVVFGNLLENAVAAVRDQCAARPGMRIGAHDDGRNGAGVGGMGGGRVGEHAGGPFDDGSHGVAEDTGHAFLTVRAQVDDGGELFVTVDNSFDGEPRRDAAGRWLSSRHDGVGVGLESVRSIVDRLGGEMRVETADRVFRVSIMLPAVA